MENVLLMNWEVGVFENTAAVVVVKNRFITIGSPLVFLFWKIRLGFS